MKSNKILTKSSNYNEFSIELVKEFYNKLIINLNEFNNSFENDLREWIKITLEQINTNVVKFLEFMQDHEKIDIWFSSLIGFFYQHGIGCDVDEHNALEMYLLSIKQEKNVNNLIAKYLIALFYYKDIILDKNIINNTNVKSHSKIFTLENDYTIPKYETKEIITFENFNESKPVEDDKSEKLDINNSENYKNNNQNNVQIEPFENENSDTLYFLGFKCLYVDKDEMKAIKYYLKSAEKGNDKAQYSLGRFYQEGFIVDKDLKRAFEWYLKSAEGGNMSAMNLLGYYYTNGIGGIEKDQRKAFEWYLKSAEGGNTYLFSFVANHYANGIGTPKNEKKAFECYLKSAEGGYVNAYFDLAGCYLNGIGTEKDEKKAFECYLKSAEGGNHYASYILAGYYSNGIGTKRDKRKAFECYLKSAERGNINASFELAGYYADGIGTAKDEKKAFQWYLKSAEEGNGHAYYTLAECYANGIGIQRNDKRAFEWYLKSAEKDSRGQYNVGNCYHFGIGTEANIEEAIEWYVRASSCGSINAEDALNVLLLNNQINQSRIDRIKSILSYNSVFKP